MLIAVLRLGAVGDTLLAAEALLALRAWRPAAHIGVVGRRDVGAVLQRWGLVDAWEDVESPLGAWLVGGMARDREVTGRSALAAPDLAVVWRRQDAAAIAARWREIGCGETLCASSLPPDGAREHVAAHMLGTLAPLGISAPGPTAIAERAQRLAGEGRRLLDALGLPGPVVALHPGSGGEAKRWPPLRFAALGRSLERDSGILLLSGPADGGLAAEVQRAAERRWPVLDAAALTTLAAVSAATIAYVGNDSGPSHLAALSGCTTIALYGPTDPAVWGVRGPHARALLPPGVDCERWRPHPVAAITVEQVLATLRAMGVGRGS